MTIKFIDLSAQRRRFAPQIDRAVTRVLDHGRFILGPEVDELEELLQAFSGARHCVTCANGTDALELALSAMNIGRGDAVVVPAFSYVATAEAVVRVGATPVFADVDAEMFNLCPESAETAIRTAKDLGLSVRCIIPVDLFGQPADYAAIHQLAETHGLKILADAAQSFGATWEGRRIGALADVTTTSFYPSKPLGCHGDGGAIFTNDATLASLLRSLRCHGQAAQGGSFARIGRNSRLDTIQTAVLIEKLAAFEGEIGARNVATARHAEKLPPAVIVPKIAEGNESVWAQYTVKVGAARDDVVAACKATGVPIAIYYAKPLHRLPAYKQFPTASSQLETTEALCKSVLSLPMHADLDERAQDYVIAAIGEAVAAHKQKPLHAHV